MVPDTIRLLVMLKKWIDIMARKYNVVIEKDEDGYYVGSVPSLPGCHTQAKTMDELLKRVKEAIALYLESEGEPAGYENEFVGVQVVEA